MKHNYGLDSQVLPSLVATTAAAATWSDRNLDVIWISNIRPFKRPDLALQLAILEPAITLHIVGGTQPGFETYYGEFQRQAARLPNVVFHGHLPYEATNQLLARARVLINTSDSEGFPNTYMQAWMRGTIVITMFDPDGVIARERLGQAVRTVEQMRAAIRAILADEHAWRTTSMRCRSYVISRHCDPALDGYDRALAALLTK
jgi:glycosyltransferase involved in cell wall biosynthesis